MNRRDIFKAAIGVVVAPLVPVATLSTNTITCAAHEFIDGDVIRFPPAGILPAGLEAATDYYVVSAKSGTFKVSL